MLRGFRESLRPFADDRGRRCGFVREWRVSSVEKPPKHWAHLTEVRQDLLIGNAALMHAPSLLVMTLLGWSGWQAWVLVIAAEIPIIWALSPIVTRPLFYPLSHIYRHQVVASGACASCGYSLAGLPVAPDGYIDCPECRAGWRVDRLRRLEPTEGAERRRELRSKLPPVLRLAGGMHSTDHRDRPASLLTFRPGRVWSSDYGFACRDAATSIRQPGQTRSAAVMVACFLAAAAVFLIGLTIGNATGPAPWLQYVVLVLFAVLLFSGFAAGVSDLFADPEQIQRATLGKGLCPSCWELLEGIPPDTDGCTMCPECGSSWRLPEPLTPSASAPAPAPHSQSSPARPETSR